MDTERSEEREEWLSSNCLTIKGGYMFRKRRNVAGKSSAPTVSPASGAATNVA